MDKPKILIVDEREGVQRFYQDRLGQLVEIIPATDIYKAFEFFCRDWRDLKLVVLDGKMLGIETVQLAAFIRKRVTIPMIAACSQASIQRRLISEGGCTHPEARKEQVEILIRNMLNLY